MVVVTGDVQPAAIVPMIERHFGGFTPARRRTGRRRPTPRQPSRRSTPCWSATRPSRPASRSNVVLPFDRPARQSGQGEAGAARAAGRRHAQPAPGQPRSAGRGAVRARRGRRQFDLAPAARIATAPARRRPPETWREALAAGEQELRRALDHGFSAGRARRGAGDLRNQLETAAAVRRPARSADLADQLVDAIADDAGVQLAGNRSRRSSTTCVRGLRPADIDQA